MSNKAVRWQWSITDGALRRRGLEEQMLNKPQKLIR